MQKLCAIYNGVNISKKMEDFNKLSVRDKKVCPDFVESKNEKHWRQISLRARSQIPYKIIKPFANVNIFLSYVKINILCSLHKSCHQANDWSFIGFWLLWVI